MHHLKLREEIGVGTGFIKVGNTRFLTIYYAGSAIKKNLEIVEKMIEDKTIKVKASLNEIWFCQCGSHLSTLYSLP